MIEAGFYKIQNNMIDGPNTYWGTLVVFNDSAHITQVFYLVENRSYNDMIEAGFYKIQNNMIDGPNTYWGTLVVFNDSAHITQVFYPNIDSAEISTRKGSINNFAKSAWRSISFT